MSPEIPHGIDEQIDQIRLVQEKEAKRSNPRGLRGWLRSRRSVWDENGQVIWRRPSGEISTFVPQDPRDLGKVKSLVKDYVKAQAGQTDLPELRAEEIEESLLPLVKIQ